MPHRFPCVLLTPTRTPKVKDDDETPVNESNRQHLPLLVQPAYHDVSAAPPGYRAVGDVGCMA